jgi:hypothetical protein
MTRTRIHLAVLSLAILYVGIVHGEPLVLVAETNVTYRGIVSNNIEHFQNIKYGQDTSSHAALRPLKLSRLQSTPLLMLGRLAMLVPKTKVHCGHFSIRRQTSVKTC